MKEAAPLGSWERRLTEEEVKSYFRTVAPATVIVLS
jgi:hypothetical protein